VGKTTRDKFNEFYGRETIVSEKCIDSDNGIDYYTKGTVRLGNEIKIDHCVAMSGPGGEIDLIEYYCSGGKILSKGTFSRNICVDGAFVRGSDCTAECRGQGYDSGVCRSSCQTWDEEVDMGYLSSCNPPCPPGIDCPAVQHNCYCQGEPYITIISPNGGEKWAKGQTYDIIWNLERLHEVPYGVNGANIVLRDDSKTIDKDYLIAGPSLSIDAEKYTWTIDEDIIQTGDRYKIMVVDSRGSTVQNPVTGIGPMGESDDYFSIVSAQDTTQ
jgi:hypothetical protein